MLKYKIANLNIQMDTSGRCLLQSKPYLYDFDDNEKYVTLKSDVSLRPDYYRLLTPDDAEYCSLAIMFSSYILHNDGLIIHASSVVKDNKAIFFSADSGTGKSTHTRLWLKLFKDAYILNDDKPAVRYIDNTWYAFGTPWSGSSDINRNEQVPLKAICFIKRSETNRLTRLENKEAINLLSRQVGLPKNAESRILFLDLFAKLFASIPFYQLECNMDIEAAEVASKMLED